jgi:putative membrane protein
MRALAVLAFVAGLAAGTLIVGHYGFAAVGRALLTVGWTGFLLVVLLHLGVIILCGFAWWVLLPPAPHRSAERRSAWRFVWARLVRDGGSEVLPLSQIGGHVLGARAVAVAGVAGPTAVASTVADVTMEFLAQIAYAALGLAAFSALRPAAELTLPIALGLGAAVVIASAFISAQQRGFALLERATGHLARRWAAGFAASAAAVQAAIHEIYRFRAGLLAGFALHLAAWVVGAAEPWLALEFMGVPRGFGAVLAVESLLYAARSVAFAVPNALGVQEGAYILLGGYFGIEPETALALSLMKRARDLCLGVPVLLVWQYVEVRRAWRSRSRPAGASKE